MPKEGEGMFMDEFEHDLLHTIANLDIAMKEAYKCMKKLEVIVDGKYQRRDQGRLHKASSKEQV
jgi:hypothetical protein